MGTNEIPESHLRPFKPIPEDDLRDGQNIDHLIKHRSIRKR
jgi:hypothetical protein